VVISDGANGPQGANPTGSVSITVNAVNDAPTATNLLQLLTINERRRRRCSHPHL
jgi:hypothetical protein